MTQEATYQFLVNTRLLESLPEEAKSRLLVSLKRMHFKGGTTFIRQGEEGDSLYLIERGSVEVAVDKHGVDLPVTVRGPGEVVGEMALITGEPRNANLTAVRDITLWRLDRNRFEEIRREYPEVTRILTQIMTSRLSGSSVIADRTIGDHVITEVVGRGSTSIVYKGRHATVDLPVAVKMLKHSLATDPEFLDAFENESKILSELEHENIVRVYDIKQIYRTVFIIMEYLDGDPLEAVLQIRSRLPIERAREILLQICRGLEYAHAKGIMHGDIKPANIFLLEGDRTKIVDFGLACRLGTKAEGFFGTPRYVSPEQICGDPIGRYTDIYSLGLLAYRMITGKDAFEGTDTPGLLLRHLYEDVPDPTRLVPDIPTELRGFILRATRKGPAERYASMAAVIRELDVTSRCISV
jgi:eukaryotic-like serine/threonine-protein kinase